MEIGVDSFMAATVDASGRAVDPARHLSELLEAIKLADEVSLDVFGIGEHHRREFLDSAPTVILAAAAARTRRIRLTSAVTVLSAADPVRVFQEFATLDLLSNGRAEIVAGRGSFIEAFPLFGLELEDYDSLFAEKLDLLLKVRENTMEPPARLRTQSIFCSPSGTTRRLASLATATPAARARSSSCI
jgi:alkanesulfonate monooxygenase SsuD/methylene tetrahydromethanopterin reductase-like flavin-dependent oxidoreductase (luciferase family)